ncbi:hypothetical protein CGRA01v4_09156 [Colletotrichum graminicola]|nr:hypothetical protein CGRA01v4_09156 [Colletotrichum graminicola]
MGRNSETRLFLPSKVRLSERQNGFNIPTHRQYHEVSMENGPLLITGPAGSPPTNVRQFLPRDLLFEKDNVEPVCRRSPCHFEAWVPTGAGCLRDAWLGVHRT